MQESTLQPRASGLAEWPAFLEEGRQFRRVMNGAERRPAVFTPEIVYNIAGMALEKMIMAYLMKHGALPDGHTLLELLAALQERLNLSPSLAADIAFMESFQEICGLEEYQRSAPDPAALQRILRAVNTIADRIEDALAPRAA